MAKIRHWKSRKTYEGSSNSSIKRHPKSIIFQNVCQEVRRISLETYRYFGFPSRNSPRRQKQFFAAKSVGGSANLLASAPAFSGFRLVKDRRNDATKITPRPSSEISLDSGETRVNRLCAFLGIMSGWLPFKLVRQEQNSGFIWTQLVLLCEWPNRELSRWKIRDRLWWSLVSLTS